MFTWVGLLKYWKQILAGLVTITIIFMGYVIKYQNHEIVNLKVKYEQATQDIKFQNQEVERLKKLGKDMQDNVDFTSNEIIKLNKQLQKKVTDLGYRNIKDPKEFQQLWNEAINN